jgi:hypothetical protein
MSDDEILNELKAKMEGARFQLAVEPGEASATRIARGIAENLSPEAKEKAAYFAIRRWLLEARPVG